MRYYLTNFSIDPEPNSIVYTRGNKTTMTIIKLWYDFFTKPKTKIYFELSLEDVKRILLHHLQLKRSKA